MHPVNRCMDSFPHLRNQMPYTHYYPSFEAIPPQMKVDPSRSPITYETWPYGGNYGHSIPVGCHGLCNHSCFPSYCGFRPTYPHYPPPSAFHYHGGYPLPSETYPVRYVPPPHFSMDQPRYEYDKNVTWDHQCCGCPYHSCNRKEDRNIKIEEQESDFEKKTNGEKKSSNSLVPFEFNNPSYPVVWIPSGNMNREQRNPTKLEVKEREEDTHGTRAQKNLKPSEQNPNVWSEWFPFDVNRFESLNYGGDKKITQNQPNVDSNQLPFPIFWMPCKHEEEGKRDHKEANNGQLTTENSPSNQKATSAHFAGSDDSTSHLMASQDNLDSEVEPKTMKVKNSKKKTIPVKQLEEPEDKMMTEEAEVKARGFTVEEKEDNKVKKSSENGTNRHSSFPSKTSKLPPVCLRVDPLPKRKNGNGSSRSPSPPGHKAKSQDGLDENSKSTSPQGKENIQHDMQSSICTLNKTKEVEPNEKKRKTVEVVDGITRKDNEEGCKVWCEPQNPVNLPIVSHKEDSTSQSTTKSGTSDDGGNLKEDKESGNTEEKNFEGAFKSINATIKDESGDGQSLTQESQEDNGACKSREENPEEEKKEKSKSLSEAEAAVVIQSVYRGFEVRRWESLKKMKQIAEVREQVAEVRRRIEALESSAYIGSDNDNKQKIVIGEAIMALLLKLDTIQGLHPTIRDFRKSVAKELVNLQEKLDYLTTEKPEMYPAKLVEDPSMNIRENASIQGEQNEADVGHGNIVAESDQDKKFGSQGLCLGVSMSGTQAAETSDLLKLVEKEVCMEPEDEITGSPLGSNVDSGKEEVGPANKMKDDFTNEVLDDGQRMVLKTQTEDPELKQPVESLPLLAEENANSVHKVALPSSPRNQLEELPAVSAKVPANEDYQRNGQIETGNDEVLGVGEVEPLLAIYIDTNQEQQMPDALKEEQIVADLEDHIGRELHEDSCVKPAELLSQPQGEAVSHITDHVETSNIEELVSLKGLNVQTQGNTMDHLLDTSCQQKSGPELSLAQKEIGDCEASKPEDPHPEPSLADYDAHGDKAPIPEVPQLEHFLAQNEVQNEIHGGEQEVDIGMTTDDDHIWREKEVSLEEARECKMGSKLITGGLNQELASKPEEPHPEISLAEYEPLGDKPSKPDVPRPELLPVQNEIQSGKQKEDSGMTNDDDNSWKEEKEAPIEEAEERKMESKIITGEENQGLEMDRQEPDGLEGRQLAPASSERHEAEGELLTISPTVSVGSDIGSERDRKLLEDNEKLREMMDKLIEAGREQLTAMSNLSGRVKELEKKLARKKKLRMRQVRAGSSCVKPSNDSLQGRAPRATV